MKTFKSHDMCFCISDECSKLMGCKRNVVHYDLDPNEYITCMYDCKDFELYINGKGEDE